MSTTARQADERLADVLDRQQKQRDADAEIIRRERRAVWLRLHEEHGMRYEDIAARFGYGTTTVHTELRRARNEQRQAT